MPFFSSKPHLLLLLLIICFLAPLLTHRSQHHSISPIISHCHPSYLLPSSSSLPIPPLLKPEGLSRSTQITSLWLCICFQFSAINQASLGMFLSIFLNLLNISHFLLLSCFCSISPLLSPQFIKIWSFCFCHWNQNKVGPHHMFVFFFGWATSSKPILVCLSKVGCQLDRCGLQDETAVRKDTLKCQHMPEHLRFFEWCVRSRCIYEVWSVAL